MATATDRIRLGTGVNILTQTNPLYLAKQASSIDHLSGGRIDAGVGRRLAQGRIRGSRRAI